MKFDAVPIAFAAGGILAHSLRLNGQSFRKGRVLSDADVEILSKAGFEEVTVARLEKTDIAENEAAERIARAIAGAGVRLAAAFTGRVNLYAEVPGIVRLNANIVASINTTDEAITVATVSPFERVENRELIATVKIIPFAAPARAVGEVERLAAGNAVLSIAPFIAKEVALLSTITPGMKLALLDKNRTALDARLVPLGSKVAFEQRVSHRIDELAAAITSANEAGSDPILVFGASATTDRRDVVPAAIAAAGGRVEHFGMPVDPGNLLLLGRLGRTVVVGLPGCARSPKLNGFDFVLQRVLADIPIGSADIAAMGVGGLLQEIASRPQPRETATGASPARAPEIAAVILAAGLSTRMGRNKLVAEARGKPILRHVVETAIKSSANPVIVVTGNDADNVEKTLAALPVAVVRNPDFRAGLSASLIAGINAVPPDCEGALVLLGDMPGVSQALIDRLIAALNPEEDRSICVPTFHHKRGNPVLWSRKFFPEIRTLTGDAGAKSLLAAHSESVCEVEAADDGPLFDIDTPDALAQFAGKTA